MPSEAIQPQNIKAAATWNAGGQDYDRISQTIADSIEHCVIRLAPRSGERVLDVGTGTGWAARRVATRGATVVGVDLARIIHERFYCNRAFATATSWHAGFAACGRAGSPLGRSTYCFKYASLPRGSTRPSRHASARFRHEPS